MELNHLMLWENNRLIALMRSSPALFLSNSSHPMYIPFTVGGRASINNLFDWRSIISKLIWPPSDSENLKRQKLS